MNKSREDPALIWIMTLNEETTSYHLSTPKLHNRVVLTLLGKGLCPMPYPQKEQRNLLTQKLLITFTPAHFEDVFLPSHFSTLKPHGLSMNDVKS